MSEKSETRSLFTADKSYYINVVIMLILMIGFRFLPPFGSMTESGMAVLGVFLGTIYGWLMVKDMPLASAAGLVLMGTTGFYETPVASIQAAFSHNLFISVVGCFAIVAVMQHSGMIEYLVKAILKWKLARTSIPSLLFIVTLFSFVVGFFGNFGMYILIWTMWKGIVEEIHGDKNLLEFGISLTSIGFVLCALAFQFIPSTMVFEGLYVSSTGLDTPSTPVFFCWTCLAFVLITLLFLLAGKFVFKIHFPKMAKSEEKLEPMTSYQFVTLVLFVLYLFILIISNCVDIPLFTFLGGFNIAGLGIAALVICLIIRPKGCYDSIGKAMSDSMQWGMLLNMGIVGVFTASLGSKELGITESIANACEFLADLPPILFVIVILVLPGILTQFLNNLALGTIFIPVACTMAMEMDLNATAIFYAFLIVGNTALATPSGSANATFMFSWPDISRKSCYKYGWTIFVITLIVVLFMYFALGNIFFPPQS
ncbi:MAG: SLC13 family permease [Peptococcaceae bacterium]|nr:SLC13 family permease [Peptococcaceae bacterium]